MKKMVSGIVTLLLMSMFLTSLDTRLDGAAGTIYIRADGSIYPSTANITSADNVTYTFTSNIYEMVKIERSNITLDGNGYAIDNSHFGFSVGVRLSNVSRVAIKNMVISNPTDDGVTGISASSVSNLTIQNLGIAPGTYGIGIEIGGSEHCIINNTSSGGISLSNSRYCTINNTSVYYLYGASIVLRSSSFNTLSHSYIVTDFGSGIVLVSSHNNTMSRNNFMSDMGIDLTSSHNNTIFGNNIEGEGVDLSSSHNNRIHNNNFISGHEAFLDSSHNHIYHNNFFSVLGISCGNSTNVWDDGYPSGGNFWGYGGVDLYSGPFQNETGSDGIRDTPELVGPGNRDNYPFMNPYYNFDVAVTDISLYKTVVPHGGTLPLNITVENQGQSTVTPNFQLYATYICNPYKQFTLLQASASHGWNNTVPGPEIKAIEGDTVVLKLQPVDAVHHKFYIDYNGNAFPDEDEPQSSAFINTDITFNFTTLNPGNFTYYCAYHQETMYGELRVETAPTYSTRIRNVTLARMEKKNITVLWDMPNFSIGKYVVSAYSTPYPYETDTEDNMLIDGWVIVIMMGDITGPDDYPDGKVDMRDVSTAAKAFGSYPGFPKWNSNCDINNDKKIDMKDVATVAKHYGEIY